MEAGAHASPIRAGAEGRLAFIALMAVQVLIGYEWLMSGLAKLVRGGFPSGLADELAEKSEGVGGWYKSFLDGTVIPNSELFGVLIIIGELAVAIALIGVAVVLLARREALGAGVLKGLLVVIVAAAVIGTSMNVAFHLANGSAHPWLIPAEGFDEGVDLDSLLPLLQLVLAAYSVALLRRLRAARGPSSGAVRPPAAGGVQTSEPVGAQSSGPAGEPDSSGR